MKKKTNRIVKKIGVVGMMAAVTVVAVPVAISAVSEEKVYAAGDVQINAKNFPDEKFRKYVAEKFDTDGNGWLSDKEINAVKVMDCKDRFMNNVKGVGHFYNLTKLICGGCDLIELDVSKNTALSDLSCSNNNLSELDVSKHLSLFALGCSNNNLTELDVSNKPDLINLDCSNNKIKKLEFNKNVRFTVLNCSNNSLCALDITNNYDSASRLDYFDQVRNVILCDGEIKLSSLDPSMDAKKIVNLEGAKLSGKKLTNITGNKVTFDYVNRSEYYAESTDGKYYQGLMNVTLNINKSFTGVLNAEGQLKRLKNGIVDVNYTGLDKYSEDGIWYYFTKGIHNPSYTGLAKSTNGKFYYVRKGVWNKSYTGFTKNTYGNWFFVKNGCYDGSYTGLAYNENNG